jgi:hypothetical protein
MTQVMSDPALQIDTATAARRSAVREENRGGGRLCRVRVNAGELARLLAERPLLPGLSDNPFRRGVVRRTKAFAVAG